LRGRSTNARMEKHMEAQRQSHIPYILSISKFGVLPEEVEDSDNCGPEEI
jgi:hypothetical protein